MSQKKSCSFKIITYLLFIVEIYKAEQMAQGNIIKAIHNTVEFNVLHAHHIHRYVDN